MNQSNSGWLHDLFIEEVKPALERQCSHDIPTDVKFFDIDYDGIVSLKPEYRGLVGSDNGDGNNGRKINELPEKIVIPEVINKTAVTGFQEGMFYDNHKVKEIVLPCGASVIPDSFCRGARYLRSIRNTEHITKIGHKAFVNTFIDKALFPNLKEAATYVFRQCPVLHTVDIGNYITEIPANFFAYCASLSCVMGGASVTKIGEYAFNYTVNLKNLPLLKGVSEIGNYAFLNSRVQFDWSTLTGCTFGTQATPDGDNTTDFWSGVSYKACEHPLPTLLYQGDKRWADLKFGNTNRDMTNACAMFVTMFIHSGLSSDSDDPKVYTTPLKFMEDLGKIDPALLTAEYEPGYVDKDAAMLERLGYDVTLHKRVTLSSAIYQELCDALADGAYAYISASIQDDVNAAVNGHAVGIYGINEHGEMLIMDSRIYVPFGDLHTPDLMTYRMPLQNITGTVTDIIIVRKPKADG